MPNKAKRDLKKEEVAHGRGEWWGGELRKATQTTRSSGEKVRVGKKGRKFEREVMGETHWNWVVLRKE